MKTELRNLARLAGTVSSEVSKYTCKGEEFLSFILDVKRLSGTEDKIRVNVSAYLVKKTEEGDKLSFTGQVRSYNKEINGKNHHIIVFYAMSVEPYVKDINEVDLRGFLCKEPVNRNTPLGREICDIMLAVNREYNKSDYIPCIAWGRYGRYIAELHVGAEVEAVGRLQSREYDKTLSDGSVERRTAYEVSFGQIKEVSHG